MIRFRFISFIIICFFILDKSAKISAQQSISKIAFGSCVHLNRPVPIFDVIVRHRPDLFVFLGDNIYGDTNNKDTLLYKYKQLESLPSFLNLRNNVPIIATWDDHDYGWNDAGRHYPLKEESKEIFLDFFKEPKNSNRRIHKGIYTSYLYESGYKKIQIILLDNRTFRDNLRKYQDGILKKKYKFKLNYIPYENADSTLLGEEQWNWLESELKVPADIRIIGSGSQFGIEFNGQEAWANFPNEQARMLKLISKTKANGVIFITGDSHYAEISKIDFPGLYPVYDITSSGLSSALEWATPNSNRIKGPIMTNNFGMLTINWNDKVPTMNVEIWDVNDQRRIQLKFKLSDIYFK